MPLFLKGPLYNHDEFSFWRSGSKSQHRFFGCNPTACMSGGQTIRQINFSFPSKSSPSSVSYMLCLGSLVTLYESLPFLTLEHLTVCLSSQPSGLRRFYHINSPILSLEYTSGSSLHQCNNSPANVEAGPLMDAPWMPLQKSQHSSDSFECI